ncbi:hypothetical protein ZIOFF_062784 [Zingiber officinale]|uniref:Hcy-binding domain-containing protein n=1 Tax=Zingiber officinale TaxID=94328 RepID=A0A8J5KAY0_ZINOF|nr:hypothetical protein ZIOFF_062784 [Zingiber officinale]
MIKLRLHSYLPQREKQRCLCFDVLKDGEDSAARDLVAGVEWETGILDWADLDSAFARYIVMDAGSFFRFASLFALRLLQLQNCKVKDIYHVNRNVPSVTVNYSTSASSISSSEPATTLQLEVKIQIQQAKKFAVSQAQQEGCLGNYRSFDSPFGSYGAYLGDGSEYSGNYGQEITVEIVKDFHRRRLEVLSEAGADIIAFETIPNKLEAQVSFDLFVELSNGSCSSFVAHLAKIEIQNRAYVELLLECDTKIPAWFSFTSKDGINVVSGDSMAECVSLADSCNKVVAIGINCTAPRFIHNLILSIKKVIEDMSIQVNVPALAMEEVAPLVVSDLAMLAPEEIFHGKGNIKEEAELTKEERKRRRANQKRRFRRLKGIRGMRDHALWSGTQA